jgi:aerobic C4-dicarboxylate transport protein
MSECRALTNLAGNAVATVVISRWEGEVSAAQVRLALETLPQTSAADADLGETLAASSEGRR